MAYQQDFLEEDKDQQVAAPTVGPEVASTTGAPGAQATASAEARPNQGSGFTNLQTYVDANKEQSKGMADGVIGTIQGNVDAAGKAQGALTQEAQTRTAPDAGRTKAASDVTQAFQSSPGSFAQQNWQDAYKQTQQAYNGPKAIQDLAAYAPAVQSVNKAEQSRKSLTDTNLLKEDIRSTYAKPGAQYTQGMNTLDSFLASSGTGGQALQNYRQDLDKKNLAGQWADQQAALNNMIKQGQSQAAQSSAAVAQARAGKEAGLAQKFDQQSRDAAAEGRRLGDVYDPADRTAYEALRALIGQVGNVDFTPSMKTGAAMPNEVTTAPPAGPSKQETIPQFAYKMPAVLDKSLTPNSSKVDKITMPGQPSTAPILDTSGLDEAIRILEKDKNQTGVTIKG